MPNDPHRRVRALCAALLAALFLWPATGGCQTSSRMLISSGSGVPGNPGFVFGPFAGLAMNSLRQIAFLSTIHSERNDRKVIVRSSGVSFSIAAFQGLVSPVSRMLFDSFSDPSINASGTIAFSAKLVAKEGETPPSSGVFTVAGESTHVVAAAGENVPGHAGTFREFSAPVIGSSGSVLFAASLSGSPASSGLYLSTAHGIAPVDMPADFHLAPGALLVPVFQSQDESVWASRDAPRSAALDQFFRAIAIKNFQELNPPAQTADTATVLGPAAGETPVQLLLVVLDGEKAETAELQGDPTQPVIGKLTSGPPLDLPLGTVQAQAPGAISGSVVFVAAPLAHPDALGIYCFCGGGADLLTPPSSLAPTGYDATLRSIQAFAGDGQHTLGFIASADASQEANAIYVLSLP